MMAVRTCSEICIDADSNCEDYNKLCELWNYVVKNKYKYPLVELEFIREHISNYVKEIVQKDAVQFRETFGFLFE